MRRLVVCLAVTVLVSGVALTNASSSLAATIADIVDQVDPARYEAYQVAVESMGLGHYNASYDQGYRDRNGWKGDGSLGNQEARLYLSDQFNTFGLNVAIQGSYLNVVGELPGTVSPDNIVIVCGHYDHVGGGVGNERPGGDDNASGTAGVLEAARVLSQYQFESTIRFIGFNAEEDGLLGSKDYVNNVVLPAGENIVGVINLDMILRPGWDNDASEPSDLDVVTKNVPVCTDWADTFITAAGNYASSLSIDATSPYTGSSWGPSDHAPFANAGYPAILAIEGTAGEIWDGANQYYHGPEDASDRLANDPGSPSGVTYDYDFATDIVAATVATVAQTAISVPSALGPADFDQDGNVDIVDLNLLTAEANLPVGVAVPQADAKFDLTGDDIVDSEDLDQWLAEAATINGLGSPYLRGDANLDGDVDVWVFDDSGDAQVLSENMGMMTGAVWGDGDFNGDGDVDVWQVDSFGDAQLLSQNMGSTNDVGAAPVPEPSAVALLAMGVVGLLAYAIRRRK